VIRAAVILAIVAALIGAAEWRLAEPSAAALPPPPTRLQAVADEFTLTLSRAWIPNRKVRIELVNFGEDPHDLRLRRIGGTHTFTMAETLPGERRLKTFRLPVGRYRVWCAVDGHREWGMRATLRVGRS
jgi:hypothetical protein